MSRSHRNRAAEIATVTKRDAAEKVADDSANSQESTTAKAQAEKFIAEYGLTEEDLMWGEISAAYNDLATRIESMGDADKVTRMWQIATLIRTAAFITHDAPIITELKIVFDTPRRLHP
jgi:hypothetical protein